MSQLFLKIKVCHGNEYLIKIYKWVKWVPYKDIQMSPMRNENGGLSCRAGRVAVVNGSWHCLAAWLAALLASLLGWPRTTPSRTWPSTPTTTHENSVVIVNGKRVILKIWISNVYSVQFRFYFQLVWLIEVKLSVYFNKCFWFKSLNCDVSFL